MLHTKIIDSKEEKILTSNAEKFIKNFDKYLDFVKENNIKCIYVKPRSRVSNKVLSNQKIVLTGFRDEDIQNKIEENGGTLQSTINKGTTLLIIKNKETSGSKIKKAKELNIKIITLDDFKNEFKL